MLWRFEIDMFLFTVPTHFIGRMNFKKFVGVCVTFAILILVMSTIQSTKSKKFNFREEKDDDDTRHEHICHRVSEFEIDKCEFAKKHCDEEGLIPYIKTRYCTFFKFVPWAFYILCVPYFRFI